MKRNKETWIWILCAIIIWVLFLFGDAYFSHISQNMWTQEVQIVQKEIIAKQDKPKNDTNLKNSDISHGSAQSSLSAKPLHIDTDLDSENNDYMDDYDRDYSTLWDIDDMWFTYDDIDTQDTGISYDDVATLQKIYEKNPNPTTLNLLVSKLIQWYQFGLAREYLANINIFQEPNVSIKDYIYVYINTLSITDTSSIQRFKTFIDDAKNNYYISNDDYLFYKWLSDIWTSNYNIAMSWFSSISSPVYKQFISQFSWALSNFSVQQGVPLYYKDALVALVCLKNWYFALANKLAVQSSLQNDEYILPYQILSYSNFLTQDREKSINYFYKLSSLDSDDYEKYNFYIWIAYYRYGNYEKSIAALIPLINSVYKEDAYRYLLLDYEKIWDKNKMIQVWQKQLWTMHLKSSDFRYFFDKFFFDPFSNGENFKFYREYKQMAYDFIAACYEKLWENNDTCIYGNVWLDIANSNRNSARDNLIYLSQNYPQASIYQALWNYYKIIWNTKQAKTYFLKAVAMSQNPTQKNLIESSLLKSLPD